MNSNKFCEAMSELDEKYISEAVSYKKNAKKTVRIQWGVLAACLCLVAVFAIVHLWKMDGAPGSNLNDTVEKDPTAGIGPGVGEDPMADIEPGIREDLQAGIRPGSEEDPSADIGLEATPDVPDSSNTVSIVYNDVDTNPTGGAVAMFDLPTEAFCPMSAEETLAYFGVTLPEEGLLPGLELTDGGCFGGGHGMYRTESRGVFYDQNSYLFANQDKKVILTLSRTFHLMPLETTVAKGPDPIEFTEIHGWKLAFYRFTDWFIDEEGRKCVYTEFLLDDVICTVSAVGLEDDELAQALMNLLPQKECVQDPVVVTGIVEHVDNRTFHYSYNFGKEHVYGEQHDYIEVDCGGTPLTVWLLGEADRFSKGDCVTVTYNGEPATIRNIWPGQLVSVELQ